MARKLHIGGEVRHPEWEVFNIQAGEHVDHVGDAKDLSRFADETFDEIYASHILEHFDYKDTLNIALKEWYRVLRKEGKMSISVPNIQVICGLILNKEFNADQRFFLLRMILGGHMNPYDYHNTGFDKDILGFFLGTAGFKRMDIVKEFGIFKDASSLRFKDTLISLNVVVYKQ
jgi:predicted SAM-dependent methyltransferase